MRAIWLTVLAMLLLLGCSGVRLNSSEQAYLRTVLATPLDFEIPEDSVPEAWMRARTFIENYGTSRVQTLTDTVIRSAPPGRGLDFRYTVRRVPQGETSRISVEVLASDLRSGPLADRNARILAKYMQTGELPYPDLIAR